MEQTKKQFLLEQLRSGKYIQATLYIDYSDLENFPCLAELTQCSLNFKGWSDKIDETYTADLKHTRDLKIEIMMIDFLDQKGKKITKDYRNLESLVQAAE